MASNSDRRFFEEHGWLIVRAAVDPERVDRLEAALDALIPESHYPAWGGRVVEAAGVSRGSSELARLARDPELAQLAAGALGVREVQLLQDTALIKPVGAPTRIEWHQDYSYLAYLDRASVVTVRLALTRCSIESGCMRVLDGSHAWGVRGDNLAFCHDRVEDALAALPPELGDRAADAEVPLELGPGDVSLHHCLTFHSSQENRSAHPRKTLAVRIMDAACRLVPSRLPSAEMAPYFPTDASGRLASLRVPDLVVGLKPRASSLSGSSGLERASSPPLPRRRCASLLNVGARWVIRSVPQRRNNKSRFLVASHDFGPEPVWILGHNTNSIQEVNDALDQGANAVEIDVTAYAHDLDALCIDHAGIMGDDPGQASAPAFEPFLRDLREVADRRPELCMVELDLKPPASRPQFGPVLLGAVREILTRDTTLSVILSIADVTTSHSDRPSGSSVFDEIGHDVRAREGFMIDSDNDLDGVVDFFSRRLGVSRFGYGNGTAIPLLDEGAKRYRTPIEKAAWMRTVRGSPGFVEAWTVNSVENLKLYLRLGVNGLICDPPGIERVRDLLRQREFSERCRLAQRSDDPMAAGSFAYGLTVATTRQSFAGTDANITFTLGGDRGSASTTVDSSVHARMESGSTSFVVLRSANLGALRSITVQSDTRRLASGWHLDSIVVESSRYGGRKTASFDTWIESTEPVTRALVEIEPSELG